MDSFRVEVKMVRGYIRGFAYCLRCVADVAADQGMRTRALPDAWGDWMIDEDHAEWQKLRKRVEAMRLSLLPITKQAARDLESGFSGEPRTLGDARFCLDLAASLHFSGKTKKRIVPCAACSRFFVAQTSRAVFCSPKCGVYLFRGRQDAEGRERLRCKAKGYMRKQRLKPKPTEPAPP